MKRGFLALFALGLIGLIGFWYLTIPTPITATELARAITSHKPDLANGERIFNIGGCVSCHAAKGAKDDDRLKLLGGQAFKTPFGTFRAPNISQDPDTGIGRWSIGDIVNAVKRGVSPDGRHYYPAFPYTSYARLEMNDALDLAAYLKSLPAVPNHVADHDLTFPFNIRRGLGLWKLLFLKTEPVVALANASEDARRGQYLVEGPGHCGECHTPRNAIGGPDLTRWLAGAPVLDGENGRTPDITPAPKALGNWSSSDISDYLANGMTPDGDFAGGAMAEVVGNLGHIPKSDRDAIAAYLRAIPPLDPVVVAKPASN